MHFQAEAHAARGAERIDRLKTLLAREQLDALACALPANVLLLSGYWPVVGTSLALATADGEVHLIAPEDEKNLAERGWAKTLRSFRPASLDALRNTADAISRPLREVADELKLEACRIGYEAGSMIEPASYAAMHLYGNDILALLQATFSPERLVPADELIETLRAFKTPHEIDALRTACAIARSAYEEGASMLRPGRRESEVAAAFRAPLSIEGIGRQGVERADGFVFCMSGPNAAQAFGAYARSRARVVERGDFVLVHCNSYADGYWTDITRSYVMGPPDARQRAIHDAISEARAAAMAAIRPGARACDVDRATRDTLGRHGFGDAFKHPTGHGVGFGAIDHNALPRLHPRSDDILQPGMVFNVEPAVYIDHCGGARHCDVVALGGPGPEILTPFQHSPETLSIMT